MYPTTFPTITVHTPDGDFSAYVARPAILPAPVIVVLQEIFGVNADMRQSADELAAQGFIAVCPDLFWRQAPNVELSDKTDWDAGFKLLGAYDHSQGVLDIAATIGAARGMEGASGKVGLMGFCLGGLMTYLTAVRVGVDAGVWYYGGNTDAFLDEADRLADPFLMHVGTDDEYIAPHAQQAIAAAVRSKPNVQWHVYPGCAHAFARHRGTKFDDAAAHLANSRTVAFFRHHLAPQQADAPVIEDHQEHALDEALAESFPSSDPVAIYIAGASGPHARA